MRKSCAAPPSHTIRVIYALPDRQHQVEVAAAGEMTVSGAVERSGLCTRFPEILSRPLSCAVFGQSVSLDRKVIPGDRIEILRPLLIDPKENRRRSAARARPRGR